MTKKTMHTIMLKHDNPKTPLELFQRIFWRNGEEEAKKILELYKLIKDEKLSRKSWAETANRLGLKRLSYYGGIGDLRSVGLIYNRDGKWRASSDFLTRLERLVEVAEELTGERSILRRG